MKRNVFGKLLNFLNELERNNIHYSLAHNRDETVMVIAAVPGERWEIEFADDGTVEIERFISSGDICGEEALSELFAQFSDKETDEAADYLLASPA